MDEYLEAVRDAVTSPAALAVAAVLGAAIAGHIVTRLLRGLWLHLARRTRTDWDDQLAHRLGGPLSTLIALQLLRLAIGWIELGPVPTRIVLEGAKVLTVVTVIWAAFRAIDVVRATLSLRSWAVERPASRSLLALGARFAKVAALIMGALVALSQLGVSIASLIAGLGIGGLVIALAAQKTVENLFGAVSIGIDQPMREGDFVKVYDFVGTVEQIGLRSTRIRTLDRTLITIPNGEMANQRIESYTVRDRIRLACMIGLEYGTTVAQVREVIAALTGILRAHPKIWPDAVIVRFQKFGESSLDLEVMAWFQTGDWGEFQGIREEILLAFMEAVERAGTSFAFPTRTIHVASGAPPAS
jgi:MscS family membrane protein